jgi:hypothetical protein
MPHAQCPMPNAQCPMPHNIFLGNLNIGNMGAILVNLVVCVHINSIFGTDCGEYKICSQARRNRRTQPAA